MIQANRALCVFMVLAFGGCILFTTREAGAESGAGTPSRSCRSQKLRISHTHDAGTEAECSLHTSLTDSL